MELRVERTNLANQLKHVDATLAVLGRLNATMSNLEVHHKEFRSQSGDFRNG